MSSLLTACGLDDSQKVAVTLMNNMLAKASEPTAEERLSKVASILSASNEGLKLDTESRRKRALEKIQMGMVFGIEQPYYIGNAPKEPQTDTRRSIIIRLPKAAVPKLIKETPTKDEYNIVILQKEGSDWKVLKTKSANESDAAGEIDWIEVKPTDFLGE